MGAAEIVYRHGNARRGSNLWASAGFGDVANCAGNRMLSEKDPPGFQQTPSRWRLPSVHECSLLFIGDQPEMRGRIARVNRIANFSQLLQKFGRLQI
jgi:hypothetical protein